MSIRIARSTRSASRTAFFVSACLWSFNSFSDIGWLLATTAILALFIYLSALKIGQMLASREFAAALAADPGTSRPIILFLRSFGIARSSLGSRFMMELSDIVQTGLGNLRYNWAWWGGLLRGGFTMAAVQAEISSHPRMGFAQHRPYEIEENLDNAIGLNAMFVALGNRLASYGAAKITVKDEDWQKIFCRLANASQLIFMMPGPSPGALWELWQIMSSRSLLEKTVFVMPAEGPSLFKSSPLTEWTILSDAAAEIGVRFPPYSRAGCYFRLCDDEGPGQPETFKMMERRRMIGITNQAIIVPTDIVALEPFTRALSKFVTSPEYTGVVDFASIWKLVNW
jgi:hypothetical protein